MDGQVGYMYLFCEIQLIELLDSSLVIIPLLLSLLIAIYTRQTKTRK